MCNTRAFRRRRSVYLFCEAQNLFHVVCFESSGILWRSRTQDRKAESRGSRGGKIKRLCSPSPHCSKQIPTFHLADADDPVGYGQSLQQTIGAQGLIKAWQVSPNAKNGADKSRSSTLNKSISSVCEPDACLLSNMAAWGPGHCSLIQLAVEPNW